MSSNEDWLRKESFSFNGTFWSRPGVRIYYAEQGFFVAVVEEKMNEFAHFGETPEGAREKALLLQRKHLKSPVIGRV